MGEDYTQKVQENFKKLSTSDTIGGPLHMSHPVKSFRTIKLLITLALGPCLVKDKTDVMSSR